MFPLYVNANPTGWHDFITRKNDSSFQTLTQQIWERDQFTCQYCGIPLKGGQEVINCDGYYTNNTLSNLATACRFCTQCGFLEAIGADNYGGGLLIYLPEITQASLNGFCYALFKVMEEATMQEEQVAQQAYRALSLRAELVERHLGTGMSDPAVFGQLLVESEVHPKDNTLIANLRLLPIYAAFKEYIKNEVNYDALEYDS